jgi:aminoglycoside phosphotransferase (APT) family kinase protein
VADAAEVSRRLAAYLETPLDGLRVLASGWETTIFEFTPARRSPRLPEAESGRRLVLRCYAGTRAADKGGRESRVIAALARAGFPVPQPYLYESDPTSLEGPFMIMERVAGGPLFAARSFPQAFKTFSLGFIEFVRAQTRLHRLPADLPDLPEVANQFEPPATTLLDRLLATISDRVEQGPLPGLRDALTFLRERSARFRSSPAAIVHLDYHPQNVIVRGVRVTGVIDWVSADRGDRHLCAATTSMILASSAMAEPRWMRDNAAGNFLRALFTALYVPLYQALAPMEWERFRYCQAVAALQRLSMFGMMRVRGPEAVGFRPDAIKNVTPDVVRLLSRYTARKTGVPVRITEAAPA